MKQYLILSVILVCICLLLAAGCSMPAQQAPAQHPAVQQTASTSSPESSGDALFAQGEKEYQDNNYHAAEMYFTLAKENYSDGRRPGLLPQSPGHAVPVTGYQS